MLDAFLEHKDCEVTAICDIYQPYLDFSAKKSHRPALDIGTSLTTIAHTPQNRVHLKCWISQLKRGSRHDAETNSHGSNHGEIEMTGEAIASQKPVA